MVKGKIVESGIHDELMKTGGMYYKLAIGLSL
jgi:ABC-type multidrug transport system fused ATPase/permease subunit